VAKEVLRDLDFTRAARELSPDHSQSMRSRISKRYAYFQRLCEFFFAEPAGQSVFGRKRRQALRKRTHPRTILRTPNGSLDATRPKFVGPRGHTSPTYGRTKRPIVRPVMLIEEGML
jgi:hypothetical protein